MANPSNVATETDHTHHADIRVRYDAAVRLARHAAESTLEPFHALAFEVETKGDGSVVTAIDRDTEAKLTERIRSEFPDDGILGEEHGEIAGTSGYRWVLDPIDGTMSFIRGVPLYGTLVAVERLDTDSGSHESVVGVIWMPGLGEGVSAAAGMGALHHRDGFEDRPARVSKTTDLSGAMLAFTSQTYFTRAGSGPVMQRLMNAGMDARGWSDCYAHVLCATGRVDVVVEPGLAPWDVAPMTVIMHEAGGRGTDWNNRVDAHGGNFLSSNGAVHDQVLNLINQA
jgi:histidinol-phosphatase